MGFIGNAANSGWYRISTHHISVLAASLCSIETSPVFVTVYSGQQVNEGKISAPRGSLKHYYIDCQNLPLKSLVGKDIYWRDNLHFQFILLFSMLEISLFFITEVLTGSKCGWGLGPLTCLLPQLQSYKPTFSKFPPLPTLYTPPKYTQPLLKSPFHPKSFSFRKITSKIIFCLNSVFSRQWFKVPIIIPIN